MKKSTAILMLAALLAPAAAGAQSSVSLDPEYGGRLSAGIEKKICKGLHLTAEEEIRLDNNFASLDRLQTTVGIDYKVVQGVKVGAGLAMINHYDADESAFNNTRFRLMLDATGYLDFGLWRLSLKERLQTTVRTGDFNPYQNPTLGVALKSRLKIQYRGWQKVKPYAYVELRNTLFAPVVVANMDTVTGYFYSQNNELYGEAGWFIDSYSGSSLNRVRGSVGIDWRLDKRNSLTVGILADYCIDKVIDANSEGTRLKSYNKETGFVGWISAGYSYSF